MFNPFTTARPCCALTSPLLLLLKLGPMAVYRIIARELWMMSDVT